MKDLASRPQPAGHKLSLTSWKGFLAGLVALLVTLSLVFAMTPKANADPSDPGQPDPTISATDDTATPPADDVTPPVDDDATPPEDVPAPPTPSTTGWSATSPTTITASGSGYIPIPWDTSAIDDGSYTSTLNRAVALPTAYDLRSMHPTYLSGVRDQGGWGTCWAFAASEAAGAALVRNGVLSGYESPVSYRQVSPLHLVQATYYTSTFKADPSPLSDNNAYQQGGNDLMAAATWSHWYGAQTEAAYPYPLSQSNTKTLPFVPSSADLKSSAYHLSGMYVLPSPYDSKGNYSSGNVAAIKNAVYTYGSVTTSYAGSLMGTYYKSDGTNSSFYDPNRNSSSHSVLVIGWNDNFAQSNFIYPPPYPGAFLIQNSWGAGYMDYFWLSYYDHSMGSSAVYDMVSATATADHHSPYEWTKQYSYDSLGAFGALTKYTNSITYANKFTVSANTFLRATQIVTQQPNMKYKVAVYVGSIRSNSPVTGGSTRALTSSGAKSVSGTLTYAGYNTITFDKPVVLKKGQKFSIVVTLTAPSGTVAAISTEENFGTPAGTAKVSISAGQSYAKDGSRWYDLTTIYKSIRKNGVMGNANIIALTSPAPKYQLYFNANLGSVSTSSKTVTFNSKLGTLPTPTRTGYSFTGWYTATSGGTKYTSTKVMSFLTDKTVYARWKAKTYTAKFNANGGATPTKSGKKYTSKTVTFDKTYGALPTTKRTGYTFTGWFTDKIAGTQVTSTTPINSTGTRTLYAHWTPNTYTVKFDAGKGMLATWDPTSKPVVYGSTYGTMPQPTRDGWVFTGWYTKTSGGTKITDASKVTFTGTRTLYAHWTRIA